MPDAKPTRAASTEAEYRERFHQMGARFVSEVGATPGEDPEGFVSWLLAGMGGLQPTSRRKYRAAVSFGLHCLREDATANAAARLTAALERLKQPLSQVADPLPAAEVAVPRPAPATSARKMKRAGNTIFAQLDAELAKRRSRYDPALRTYMPAGRATGLRPCEWRCARLVLGRDRALLVVRNAKDTNGRAHGRFRRLVWDNPAAPEVAAVATWLHHLRGPHGQRRRSPEAFADFMQALRDRIRHVGQALWPRRTLRPTLYTVRHVFAARAKQRYGPVEIAALMGHAHDATAQSHYARPPRGKGPSVAKGDLPRPHPRDVARVRAVYEARRAFLDTCREVGHAPRP